MSKKDFAVVLCQGKQYKINKDQEVITVDHFKGQCGDVVNLETICRCVDGKLDLTPAPVKGEILNHQKGNKIIVMKFKRRKGYKVTTGYRSQLTKIRVHLTQ